MSQEVKYIDLGDLVLWSENPRDPINPKATDQDVIDHALLDKNSKWTLSKLAKDMGDYYDLSELPTVVYHENKPIVYDGNRRIILGKIKYGYAKVEDEGLVIPEFPNKLPCNVCSEDIALLNVLRKHGDSGSWSPLDRDIFLHKFLKRDKSLFLKLEENTGLISNNPHLNQGFVKKEIFNAERLNELGFGFEEDTLTSKHDSEQSKSILIDISLQIARKNITTRRNRGNVVAVLEKSNRDLIEANKGKSLTPLTVRFKEKSETEKPPKQTRRTKKKQADLFGGKLYLKPGDVSNLYRDITDLYKFYASNKNELSQSFPSLIRMSLRLLCECASKDVKKTLENYLKSNFKGAKKDLETDDKTTLSNQNVTEGNILQLLHTGAHNYQTANNMEQTMAMSIIIGRILNLSHGKEI